MYHLNYSKRAVKQLQEVEGSKVVVEWLENNIDSKDPRQYGKSLTGDVEGLWRYKIGEYRVLCHIEDDKVIVLDISTGHKKKMISFCKCLSSRHLQSDLTEMWGLFI